MKTLLVYPEFPDTFWSFKHALRFVGKRASLPPLGLLTVASMLPKSWSLRLVDENVSRLQDRDLQWADCVWISAMTVQRSAAQRLIARCKAAGLKVVAGGPLFQSERGAFRDVDHFVLNEAELTLPPFLEDLRRGHPKPFYASAGFADLRNTPQPMWQLLDLKRYGSMSIQFSRGCPFNCDFCNVTALFGRRCRTKSSAQIVAELDGLYALGWRGDVFFVDDNFIGKKGFLKADLLPLRFCHKSRFLDENRASGPKKSLHAPLRSRWAAATAIDRAPSAPAFGHGHVRLFAPRQRTVRSGDGEALESGLRAAFLSADRAARHVGTVRL